MNKKRDTERVSSIFVVLNRRPFKLMGTTGARKTSSNVERDRKYNVKIGIHNSYVLYSASTVSYNWIFAFKR